MDIRSFFRWRLLAFALPLFAAGVLPGADTYGARAELRAADGKLLTAPVTISIDRMSTTEERDALHAAFKSGDADAFRKALAGAPSVGYVSRGRDRLPIKYAFPRSSGKGKFVTIVCNEPMIYIGEDVPDVKPRKGFDLAYVLLALDAEGKGTGEIAPAVKLKLREDGSFAVAEYGAEIINLEDVAWEK